MKVGDLVNWVYRGERIMGLIIDRYSMHPEYQCFIVLIGDDKITIASSCLEVLNECR